MGQCGCGDGFGHYKVRADGGWIALKLYPGCVDCDTPAGFEVDFYPDDSPILSCLDGVPDWTQVLKERAKDGWGLNLAIFDFHDLSKSEDLEEIAEPSEYATVADLVSDMHYAIWQTCVTTINRTLKETLVP